MIPGIEKLTQKTSPKLLGERGKELENLQDLRKNSPKTQQKNFDSVRRERLNVVVKMLCKLIVVASAEFTHTQGIENRKQSWYQSPTKNQINKSTITIVKPKTMVTKPAKQKSVDNA